MRLGLGLAGRPRVTGLAAWLSRKPRHAPRLLSLPRLPLGPAGGREDHTVPAGFCSHGRKACLSTVEEPPPGEPRTAAGRRSHGDLGAAQVSQDKYCPFVSADCRDQQTDELQIIIIIIIILLIHIPKGGGKSDT